MPLHDALVLVHSSPILYKRASSYVWHVPAAATPDFHKIIAGLLRHGSMACNRNVVAFYSPPFLTLCYMLS